MSINTSVNFAETFIAQNVPPIRTDRHILGGITKVEGVGASKRIHVLLRDTDTVVASTVSRPDGTWQIKGINEFPERSLLVIAFDDTGTYNALVADFVSQVANS